MANQVPFLEAAMAMLAMMIVLTFILLIYCFIPAFRAYRRRKEQIENYWEIDPRWSEDKFLFSQSLPNDYKKDKKYSRLACSRSSSVRTQATELNDILEFSSVITIREEDEILVPDLEQVDPDGDSWERDPERDAEHPVKPVRKYASIPLPIRVDTEGRADESTINQSSKARAKNMQRSLLARINRNDLESQKSDRNTPSSRKESSAESTLTNSSEGSKNSRSLLISSTPKANGSVPPFSLKPHGTEPTKISPKSNGIGPKDTPKSNGVMPNMVKKDPAPPKFVSITDMRKRDPVPPKTVTATEVKKKDPDSGRRTDPIPPKLTIANEVTKPPERKKEANPNVAPQAVKTTPTAGGGVAKGKVGSKPKRKTTITTAILDKKNQPRVAAPSPAPAKPVPNKAPPAKTKGVPRSLVLSKTQSKTQSSST